MSGSTVGVSLAGITYQFARRRYGRTTYTWVTAVLPDGTQLDLGDPWPAFFRTLPQEVAEAAAIDGAGPWRIFFTIMLPMAKPGMASVAIFNDAMSSDFGYAAAKSVAILVAAIAAMALVVRLEERSRRVAAVPGSPAAAGVIDFSIAGQAAR